MKESTRLLRFAMVGTLNYLLTMAVIGGMTACLSFRGDYLVANITAYLIAQTHNFVWCRYWVFPSEGKGKSLRWQILLFVLAFGTAYVVQLLFVVALVEGAGMNEYAAQFAGMVIYGAVFFLANKKFTFK